MHAYIQSGRRKEQAITVCKKDKWSELVTLSTTNVIPNNNDC